ncbi:hypothetical protein H0W91_03975 [Patescibacteria group bacterium]|nr:hypothetical protein [Patescibacteria group bacterium]
MNSTLSADIIKEWGLGALPSEKQVDMVDRIGRILYQAILVKALDILSDKEQTEFDLILDEDNTTPDDVLKFLATKIPTLEQLITEERKSLKEDLLLPVS